MRIFRLAIIGLVLALIIGSAGLLFPDLELILGSSQDDFQARQKPKIHYAGDPSQVIENISIKAFYFLPAGTEKNLHLDWKNKQSVNKWLRKIRLRLTPIYTPSR